MHFSPSDIPSYSFHIFSVTIPKFPDTPSFLCKDDPVGRNLEQGHQPQQDPGPDQNFETHSRFQHGLYIFHSDFAHGLHCLMIHIPSCRQLSKYFLNIFIFIKIIANLPGIHNKFPTITRKKPALYWFCTKQAFLCLMGTFSFPFYLRQSQPGQSKQNTQSRHYAYLFM